MKEKLETICEKYKGINFVLLESNGDCGYFTTNHSFSDYTVKAIIEFCTENNLWFTFKVIENKPAIEFNELPF